MDSLKEPSHQGHWSWLMPCVCWQINMRFLEQATMPACMAPICEDYALQEFVPTTMWALLTLVASRPGDICIAPAGA